VAELTNSEVACALYLQDLLETNKVALGVRDVFYGDQVRIPYSPAICVETGRKERALNGAPRRTEITLNVHLLVYHAPIEDGQVTRLQNDLLDEAIETLIHLEDNRTLGGLVVHGMVVAIEPGYQIKAGSTYRASRIDYQATSQVQLPSQFTP
jgi:hypothetical protein